MTSKLEDEDYWNESGTTGFSFDDDEVTTASSLFQPSKLGGTGIFQEIGFSGGGAVGGFNDFGEPPLTGKPLKSLISKRSLSIILNEEPPPRVVKDLKEEVEILQRQLSTVDEAPSVESTVRSIILGKRYALHLYRSLDSKTKLLEEAVLSGDGNAILAVVLFLRKSLTKKIFVRLLQFKPAAVPAYINFLTTKCEFRAAIEILSMLGQTRDAAMKNFQHLIQPEQSLEKKAQNLRVLQRDHFNSTNIEDKTFIDNFLKLVEWQLSVPYQEKRLRATVIDALAFLCCKHWQETKGPVSPHYLFSLLSVSERQFHWIALTSLADSGSWGEIGGLLLTKGWLGAKKLKTSISAEKVVKELHKRKCPGHILMEYFELVDSSEKRLSLAKMLSWHSAVIDTYVSLRDRQGLVQYQASLNPQSNDYLHAETSLRSTVKWKN